MSTTTTLLTTLEQHRDFLKAALNQCCESINEDVDVKDVLIICPYVRSEAMEMDNLQELFKRCNENLKIYTSSCDNACMSGEYLHKAGRDFLSRYLIDFDVVHNLHTKCLILGEDTIAIGSFNWLSSFRYERTAQHDVTVVISGPDALPHIEQIYTQVANYKIMTPMQPYLLARVSNPVHSQYIEKFVSVLRANKGLLKSEDVFNIFSWIPDGKSARYRLIVLNALFDVDPHFPPEDCTRYVTDFLTSADDEPRDA